MMSKVYYAAAAVVLLVVTIAYADPTPAELKFLKKIGCTAKVLRVNDCAIEKIDPVGEYAPRNMMLVCDFPLYIKAKNTCLDRTCL